MFLKLALTKYFRKLIFTKHFVTLFSVKSRKLFTVRRQPIRAREERIEEELLLFYESALRHMKYPMSYSYHSHRTATPLKAALSSISSQ